MADDIRFRLLFVCMGNICRSPAAEGIMKKRLEEAGMNASVYVDSAGTGGWHAGDLPDHRMRRLGSKRGYTFDSRARQVRTGDFSTFDLILVMDPQNAQDLGPFDPGRTSLHKVRQFTDFAAGRPEKFVPDPYYGTDTDFEQVLDILEDGCTHLLGYLKAKVAAE
jgi:protein-tyrosine phosphatase